MTVLLGAIADDLTGATDLCNTLVRRGMRTVQLIDVPAQGTEMLDAEAFVVALKSRTIPAAEAVEKSLAALAWLQQAGARQILFKYCSTFDSTDAGNIGPAAEALMEALGTDFTLFCPAFPENGRTIYLGYLFVGDALPPIAGAAVVLSGSCSEATRAQVAYMRERAPLFTIDPIAAAAGRKIAEEAVAWATPRLGDRPVLISATAPPEEVAAIQEAVGRERAGASVDET